MMLRCCWLSQCKVHFIGWCKWIYPRYGPAVPLFWIGPPGGPHGPFLSAFPYTVLPTTSAATDHVPRRHHQRGASAALVAALNRLRDTQCTDWRVVCKRPVNYSTDAVVQANSQFVHRPGNYSAVW